MDSKTRAKLRSIAQNVSPSVSIGKTGLTDGVIDQINMNLNAHEIVKIDVLETADADKKALLNHICETLKAEPVCVIGRKIVVYRFSGKLKNHVLANN